MDRGKVDYRHCTQCSSGKIVRNTYIYVCSNCHGTGTVPYPQPHRFDPFYPTELICDSCGGHYASAFHELPQKRLI